MRLKKYIHATPSMRIQMTRSFWRRIVTRIYYRSIFQTIGKRSLLYKNVTVINSEFIRLGTSVTIREGSRLEIVLHDQNWVPRMEIGNNVNIEQNVHIICHDQVLIGDNVSIAPMCAIVDTKHPYDVCRQGKKIGAAIDSERSAVIIGANTFLGVGVTVLPGVTVGENCVIGAGSVVTRDLAVGSIAAGSPARVIGSVFLQHGE